MTIVVQVKKKAQVTLPKEVRDQLEIREGDILEVAVEAETVVLRPRPTDKISPRPVSAQSFKQLSGLVSVGGDALKDSELYEE